MKVIIIGAGVSGLAAGIYAQKNGYQAEIYEMHSIPGGECTGWDRGEYHFDGCIHWLLGSKKGHPLNEIWRVVGALDDSIQIVNREIIATHEHAGQVLHWYRDVDRLEKALLDLSPQESQEIKELTKAIRGLARLQIPVQRPLDLLGVGGTIKMIVSMLPVVSFMKYNKIDIQQLADRFQHPLIQKGIRDFMPTYYTALAYLSSLASMADGDGGWPEGGSRALALRMEKRYKELGGKVYYRSQVEKVLVDSGVARGIRLADGREVIGDWVIGACDGHETLFDLLGGEYLTPTHRQMYSSKAKVHSSFQVWLGISADLSGKDADITIPLSEPVSLGGETISQVWLKSYCFDPSLAPKGHSILSAVFMTENYQWWERVHQDKEAYKAEKKRIAQLVTQVVEERFPEARGHVETVDVATPMTYRRYCHAWRGAWMSWATTPQLKTQFLPMRLPGLSNFIMAGQWIMPPGGLPTAVITGKWAIQHLTHQEKRPFRS